MASVIFYHKDSNLLCARGCHKKCKRGEAGNDGKTDAQKRPSSMVICDGEMIRQTDGWTCLYGIKLAQHNQASLSS